MTLQQKLSLLNACEDSLEWVGDMELHEAWATCERGDWMLWLAKKAWVDLCTLTAAQAACAEFARPWMTDPSSIAALDAAHAFGRGEITELQLDAAAAAYDTSYAYDAAYAATYAAKRADVLKKCADEVRRIIPVELINF